MNAQPIIDETRISGEYYRGRDHRPFRWTVCYRSRIESYVAYTRGDSKSPCDIGWYGNIDLYAPRFPTRNAAMAYINKVIEEAKK